MKADKSMKSGAIVFAILCFVAAACAAETPACKLCKADVPSLASVTETKWLEPAARKKAWSGVYDFSNQDGKAFKLDELKGKPLAITFLYTRCENPNKCPLAATTLAKLQDAVRQAGLAEDVRLCVMTYDPEFDSSEVLKQYAAGKGVQCDANTLMLRPDPATKNALFEELNLSVNFNAERVNIHGLQMLLIDKSGRFVRSYHTLIWNNAKVLADLKKLIAE